jgi:hypothetical protein
MGISAEDKGKGKRIIMQFFKTMAHVQRALLVLFEKDEYQGIQRLLLLLNPECKVEIDSIDNLRRGLSMILQHIYSLPFEDKEGHFLELMRCKSHQEVLQKEKAAFIDYFLSNQPGFRSYLKQVAVEDGNYYVFNQICKELLDRQEEVKDLRTFKSSLRDLQNILARRMANGSSEEAILEDLKKKVKETPAPGSVSIPKSGLSALELVPDNKSLHTGEEAGKYNSSLVSERTPSLSLQPPSEEEKRRAIETILNGPKYEPLRRLLLKTVVEDPQFHTFQSYLNNILPPPERIVTRDLDSFSKGLQRIKEFRDNLERELS